MARLTLTTPGEDGSIGSGNPNQLDEVIGTTTGGEVITVNQGSRVTFDPSFNSGGDTIRLPGAANTYSVQIEGSNIVLTSTNGTVVELPLGTTANTLEFDGGVSLPIAIVGNGVNIGTQTVVDGDTIGGGGPVNGGTVTLTANPDGTQADPLEATIFNAPRVFTPGGNDQVNSLNDDDVLQGVGDAVLNFTFVNDSDTNDININPTLLDIREINVEARLDDDGTLDLQDSTGVEEINVSGVDDFVELTIDNIQDVVGDGDGLDLSINNSNADDGAVLFLLDGDAAEGGNDQVNLTLNDVDLDYVVVDDENGEGGLGVENVNLESTGDNNEIGTLFIEDAELLTITGDEDLTLGTEGTAGRIGAGGTFQAEAILYGAGLGDVAGSLTEIDASGLDADLDITIGEETIADLDETSGTPVDFVITTGDGDDVIRLIGGLDSDDDVIDAGAGDNRLVVYGDVADGDITNISTLDVRGNTENDGGAASTITVDTSIFDSLDDVWIRNEASEGGLVGNEELTVVLDEVSEDLAENLNVQHSTTGSNGLDDTTIVVNLADDAGANDVVGLTIDDKLDDEARGVNIDPRFNVTLTAAAVEDINLADNDSESNTVLLTEFADHDGTLTVTGGSAGRFLNLDAAALAGSAAGVGIYDYDVDGDDVDGPDIVDGGDAGSGAIRLVFEEIDASTYTGNFVARIGEVDTNITTGTGNDTIVFDEIGDLHAGLSISDSVNLGAGNDTVVIDGEFAGVLSVGASEWTNFDGVDNIRLADNDLGTYRITLTNELVDQTDGGSVINIINDLDPNSNGSAFDDESDVVIDARSLSSTNFFTYDGAEVGPAGAATISTDRFILADANINGGSTIDGGYNVYVDNGIAVPNGNDDVLEIRNAAVVTLGDLANISNVGTLEFTNDSAAVQESVLDLDTATINRLVNTNHVATTGEPEVLLVRAVGNDLLPTASTIVNINLEDVNFTTTAVVLETENGGFFNIIGGAGPVQFNGGAGDDDFTGTDDDDVINGGAGDDTLDGGDGADTITGGAGVDDVDTGGADGDTDVIVQEAGDSVTADSFVSSMGGIFDVGETATFDDGVDTISGFVTGQDELDLEHTFSAANLITLDDGSGGGFGIGDNEYGIVTGTWNAATNTFTVGAGGDSLLAFDADGSAGVSEEVVVFLGNTTVSVTDFA